MKFKKKILLLCLIFGFLFLTGCGIEVDTNLTINEEFEGTKTISCFVSKQDMSLHFKGDSSKIKSMLENHCPGCFDYTINETASGTEYIFALNFTSLEDYKTALTTVLHFNPEISYKGVNSIFSKSLYLEENFTSIDLLRWFEILLKEEYDISDSQITKLWNVKESSVVWNGETFSSSQDAIHISHYNMSAFDGISIYTEEKEDRTFLRKIRFAIPKETLDTRVLELEQLFQEMKPKGTTGIWTTSDTGKIYEMTFTADSFEELSKKTGEALDCESRNIYVNASASENQILKIDMEYSETLDFSRFLCTESGEVPVSYYFKPNSMTEINSERIQKEINNAFIPKEYDGGYYRLFQGNCSTLKITTLGTMNLPVLGCEINTILHKDNQFTREFTFLIENVLRDTEIDLLSSVFHSYVTDYLDILWNTKEKPFSLSIKQTGSMEDLNASSELLFGTENSKLTLEKTSFLEKISKNTPTEIIEEIDLSHIINFPKDNFSLKYTFKNETSSTLENLFIENSNQETIALEVTEDNLCSYETTDFSFTSHIIRSAPSVLGISIFLILIFLIVIGFILFKVKNPMKRYLSSENQE